MRENITVHDILGAEYVGVSEIDTVWAASELMAEEGVDSVVVLRGRKPVGMLHSRDALSALVSRENPTETPVSDVMSEPAPQIQAPADVDEAADVMFSESANTLLVFDDREFVGLLTERDVLAATSSRALDDGFDREADDAELRADGSTFEVESEEYSTQSICELCGSLVRGLSNLNGQLVCVDCRDI